jgi:streptogrisin C
MKGTLLVRRTLILLAAAAAALAFAVPAGASAPAVTAATDATTIENTMRGALGDSYGHFWLDGDKVVVGVTNPSRADAVRAMGAEPRLVKNSAAKLDGIKANFDRQWTKPPAGVASWGVDVLTNSVVIYVAGTDPKAHAFAEAARAGHDGVRVEQIAEAYQPYWNIIGGQAIYTGGSRCSAGFNARTASYRYVITAGHCTNIGSSWSGVGGTLGTRAGTSFPTNDYGIIRVTTSSAVSTPYVDRYSSGSDVRVTGASSAATGQAICRSGSTTGWRCGSVTATNQTVCYSQGCVYQMIRTNACAQPGDSGGSMVSNPGSGSTVTAKGLTSGGSGNCSTGGTTFFQPVPEVLSRYGLTLYT